jgi:2-polyprenyl-6-methoxyphenol hydroxylase-like FAD-dependent oxidoreductase
MKMLIDLGKFPAYTKSGSISRARLRSKLQEPLREKGVLAHGKTFTHFEILRDENKIRALFNDGSFEDADVIIAADGNKSRANRQLGCNNIVQLDKLEGVLGNVSYHGAFCKLYRSSFFSMERLHVYPIK